MFYDSVPAKVEYGRALGVSPFLRDWVFLKWKFEIFIVRVIYGIKGWVPHPPQWLFKGNHLVEYTY